MVVSLLPRISVFNKRVNFFSVFKKVNVKNIYADKKEILLINKIELTMNCTQLYPSPASPPPPPGAAPEQMPPLQTLQ